MAHAESSILPATDLDFGYIHAFFIFGAIVTYFVDLVLDVVLVATYIYDTYYTYALITAFLVLGPTIIVQIFSIRWHQMDGTMSKFLWTMHSLLFGVPHRYMNVLLLGFEAKKTGDEVDQQRFLQQQSDVCMLRLFDSFGESAPQLVFHLYVLIKKNGMENSETWTWDQATWTILSAMTSLVSLGWGIAAYSSSQRMVRHDKNELSWAGMIFQTLWRAGMLTARIVALVMLTLALDHWIIVVMFIHWLVMTAWVIWQDTDFCRELWEERLYNAVVGVIYCFCFFNLKEGKSRYRATIFYAIILVENFAFLSVFYFWTNPEDYYKDETFFKLTFVTVIFILETASIAIGLTCMLLYYRFFHPAGPIRPCVGDSVDFESDLEELKRTGKLTPQQEKHDKSSSLAPDFVITDENTNSSSPVLRPRRSRVTYSRSFKNSCPPLKRSREVSSATTNSNSVGTTPPEVEFAAQVATISPISNRQHYRERAIDCGGMSPVLPTQERVDSAYGTDSNRTGSPPQQKPGNGTADQGSSPNSSNGSSSVAFNNDTYMNAESAAEFFNNHHQHHQRTTTDHTNNQRKFKNSSATANNVIKKPLKKIVQNNNCSSTDKSDDNTYMSVHVQNTSNEDNFSAADDTRLLKRSPVVRDVTSGFAQISNTDQLIRRKMTILVPSLEKTISLEALNPGSTSKEQQEVPHIRNHDYENLALININRNPLGQNSKNLVSHWRTYSNMADGNHDESTAYEKRNYYDIYPLSKELKLQLYRSLTPLSTAATMASDSIASNDTYEPIENYDSVAAVTLIHHDGDKLSTRQITTMESLKEVLHKHEKVPMDDPQDRADLYILAPMRLLSPILEESSSERDQNRTVNNNTTDLNKSLMTVISEIILQPNKLQNGTSTNNINTGATTFPDGRFQDSIESTSSLVQIIEEIRNNSLCNLYCAELQQQQPKKNTSNQAAAPQVPPRNDNNNAVINKKLIKFSSSTTTVDKSKQTAPKISANNNDNIIAKNNATMEIVEEQQQHTHFEQDESPKPEEVQERRKKSPLYTSVGSRKNLLELAGTTNHILNTPQKVEPTACLSILDPAKLEQPDENWRENSNIKSAVAPPANNKRHKEFDRSTLRPFENSCSLSPSAKYETPTPPLKVNQFARNNNAYRPTRRKFSILREKFEDQQQLKLHNSNIGSSNTNVGCSIIRPAPMILKTRKNDLYENISDDFLKLRSNSLREKQERMTKCRSVPTFLQHQEKQNFVTNSQSQVGPLEQEIKHTTSHHHHHRSQELLLLKADEQYIVDENFAQRKRNQWSTASYQRPSHMPTSSTMNSNNDKNIINNNVSMKNQRNSYSRRSMSILDDYNFDKENFHPALVIPTGTVIPPSKSCLKEKQQQQQQVQQPPPPLRPKPRPVDAIRGSPKTYRLSSGASLSPNSRIFSRGGN